MARHARNDESHDDELSKHASQASALLSSRLNTRSGTTRAGQNDSAPRMSGNPTQTTQCEQGNRQDNQKPRYRREQHASEPQREPQPAQARPAQRHGQARPGSLAHFIQRNKTYIALVALVVALVTVGLFAVKAFLPLPDDNANSNGNSVDELVNPYDWSNLDRSESRYRYIVNGEVRSRIGVDVSESQGEIDWQAVAQDGIDFAIIRVGYRGITEGGLYTDEHYWANIEGARAAGIDCGVYFFSQADTVDEAIEEADFVLEHLGGTKLEYPIAFDSEVVHLNGATSPTANLSTDEMTAIAKAFCARVEAAGYKPLIYGNKADLMRYEYDEVSHLPAWWAEYGAPAPTSRIALQLWQYSNSGVVNGISTYVDMDLDLSNAL